MGSFGGARSPLYDMSYSGLPKNLSSFCLSVLLALRAAMAFLQKSLFWANKSLVTQIFQLCQCCSVHGQSQPCSLFCPWLIIRWSLSCASTVLSSANNSLLPQTSRLCLRCPVLGQPLDGASGYPSSASTGLPWPILANCVLALPLLFCHWPIT